LNPLLLSQPQSRAHRTLKQLKPDGVINCQVKYQETLSTDSSRLKCLNDPVDCTSSPPSRTAIVPFHVIVFPVSLATTDILSQGPGKMPPKYIGSGRRGIVSQRHYFFILFQQMNIFPFHCLLCWNPSIASIRAISYKNKKAASSWQG
jgi:hypothetical protein